MADIVQLRPALYEAKPFSTQTEFGRFQASGTLCGNIDFVHPTGGTCTLSPDEAHAVIVMLQNARTDVLEHSDPLHDPRILL